MQKNRYSRVHSSLQEDYPPKQSEDEEKIVFSHQNTESLLMQAEEVKPTMISPINRFKDKLDRFGGQYASQEAPLKPNVETSEYDEGAFDTHNLHRLINLEATPSRQSKQSYYLPRRAALLRVSKQDDDVDSSIDREKLESHRRKKYVRLQTRELPDLRKDPRRYHSRQSRAKTELDEEISIPPNEQSQETLLESRPSKFVNRRLRHSMDEPEHTRYLPRPDSNPLSYNYNHASFAELWRTVPRELHNRTEENMRHFAFRCHKMNPLLKKLEYVTMVEMLKVCQISIFEKNEIIYSREKRPVSSYIILWGKVSLVDTPTKSQTAYEPGETLHQDYLLEYRRYELKTLNTMAVAVQHSGLLQLNHKNLVMLKTELMEISLKSDLQILQAEFRKNYLTKLSLRQTFRVKHRSQSKHSYY